MPKYSDMKNISLFFVCWFMFSSCKRNEALDTCQLEKFVQENPLNKTFHYDYITLKDGRIEKLFSFDINLNKDTLNKVIAFFEYNQRGKVKAVRDEANPLKIKRFDADFDSNGNAVKVTSTTNNNIEDEIAVEYDSQSRPVNITSRYLFGITRSIEYDNQGNPFRIYRSDVGSSPSISEHSFDDKRNFFSGIPEIQFYWIIRPLSSFLPFGDNNIVSSRVYTYEGVQLKESINLRTKRELVYNEKGFPETIKIIREDLSSTVSNISTFSYKCQ